MTPIDTATNAPGTPIPVGSRSRSPSPSPLTGRPPTSINCNVGTVTPIDLTTNTPGTPITVGTNPDGFAITPDGTTVYVTNEIGNSVTPIAVATNTPGIAIPVGSQPFAHRHDPQRPDRLRHQLHRQLGDPGQHGHQHRRDADHRSGAAHTASPSPRTVKPLTSPTGASIP